MGNKIKDNLKEAKEKAVNAVKAFFKFLKDFAFRNSIAEKLEEIEAQLQNGIENDLYTQEQLKKLTNTMDSLAGQLRNMSPEAMKETAEKAMKEVENLIEEMYDDGRILADVNEEDFFTAMKNISGHNDMTNEQFREFFEQNAKLYDNGGMKLENGQVEGKTSMLIEIGKECYQATFDVSEPKPNEKDPNKKVRDYTLKVDKFDGSYSNAKEITSKADITKHETMLRKFILPRNLRRREDIERLDISKLVKTSVAIRDVQTIEKFSSKINESQDGKFEFFYDKKSNTFRARDKETGTALVAGMKKGELFLVPAENMSDIRDLSSEKMSRDRSIFRHEAGKGIIDFNISGMTDAQMNLFRTPEFMQFLETKGIPTEEMKYQLETSDNPEKKPRGYSKVSRKGLQNVDAVYRALYQVVSSDESAFDTRAIRDSRKFAKGSLDGAVYLSVNDKDGNMMSFSFEKDGTPRDINYRAKGGKFKLAQNLNRRGNYGANYETLRYDESFAKLFDTFDHIDISIVGSSFFARADKGDLLVGQSELFILVIGSAQFLFFDIVYIAFEPRVIQICEAIERVLFGRAFSGFKECVVSFIGLFGEHIYLHLGIFKLKELFAVGLCLFHQVVVYAVCDGNIALHDPKSCDRFIGCPGLEVSDHFGGGVKLGEHIGEHLISLGGELIFERSAVGVGHFILHLKLCLLVLHLFGIALKRYDLCGVIGIHYLVGQRIKILLCCVHTAHKGDSIAVFIGTLPHRDALWLVLRGLW